MIFVQPYKNPLPEILELISTDWVELTPRLLGDFGALLRLGGFICLDDYETSRCFDLFVETGLIEFKHETKDKNPLIRKIKNGR